MVPLCLSREHSCSVTVIEYACIRLQINGEQSGHQNAAFVVDEKDQRRCSEVSRESSSRYSLATEDLGVKSSWNNSIEFLMSCIAMSVGFGNIWRFPFTTYENGGGAFLIPYIIVLFVVGKPFYYLEMILGQFTSSSSIRIWNMSPAFVGNFHSI